MATREERKDGRLKMFFFYCSSLPLVAALSREIDVTLTRRQPVETEPSVEKTERKEARDIIQKPNDPSFTSIHPTRQIYSPSLLDPIG